MTTNTKTNRPNLTSARRTAFGGVLLLGAALSLTACDSAGGSGGPSSREFATPVEAASYWLSAVQDGDFERACEAMSPGAVADLTANTGAEDCGAALDQGLSWYGDGEPDGEGYDALFTHGTPDRIEATQCAALEVGETCWADFLWDETANASSWSVDKLLVRSPNGYQVSMIANEGEPGYDVALAGVEVEQEGGLFPTAHAEGEGE